jgi:hypothetical protein
LTLSGKGKAPMPLKVPNFTGASATPWTRRPMAWMRR